MAQTVGRIEAGMTVFELRQMIENKITVQHIAFVIGIAIVIFLIQELRK